MKFLRDDPLAAISFIGSILLLIGTIIIFLESVGFFRNGEPKISDDKWYLSISAGPEWTRTPFAIPTLAECDETLHALPDELRSKARCLKGSELRKAKT